jgi:hypothetical protein
VHGPFLNENFKRHKFPGRLHSIWCLRASCGMSPETRISDCISFYPLDHQQSAVSQRF